MTDDTRSFDPVVCRCEGLRLSQLEAALAGGTTLRDLKQRTRLGMGPCQGRVCLPLLSGRSGRPEVRPPLRPVPLAALADRAAQE